MFFRGGQRAEAQVVNERDQKKDEDTRDITLLFNILVYQNIIRCNTRLQ